MQQCGETVLWEPLPHHTSKEYYIVNSILWFGSLPNEVSDERKNGSPFWKRPLLRRRVTYVRARFIASRPRVSVCQSSYASNLLTQRLLTSVEAKSRKGLIAMISRAPSRGDSTNIAAGFHGSNQPSGRTRR